MKHVLVDVDGTLAKTVEVLLVDFNKEHGTNYSVNDIICFDFNDGVLDISKEFSKWWQEPKNALRPRPHSQVVLTVLSLTSRYIVSAATTRPEHVLPYTMRWLVRRGIMVHGLCHRQGHKSDLDGDILIDDNPIEIELWAMTGRPAILVRRPWNKYYFMSNKPIAKIPERSIYLVNQFANIGLILAYLFEGKELSYWEPTAPYLRRRYWYNSILVKSIVSTVIKAGYALPQETP